MESLLQRIAAHWQPHEGQLQFLTETATTKVLACGRRWGKTDVCAVEILAALHENSPTQHLILAPTQDQANLLFGKVTDWLERLEIKHDVRLSPHPRVRVGDHVVRARSGHVGRSLRGQEATHLIVDEAAYVPESLITEIALPMLATTNGRCTLISTPNGRNHFWRFFRVRARRAPRGVEPPGTFGRVSLRVAHVSRCAARTDL